MEEGAPQQPLTGPQQVDANQHQAESRGSQHSNPLVDHEHRGDHEGSTRTTHTDRSRSRGKGHASPVKSGGNLQQPEKDAESAVSLVSQSQAVMQNCR
nr:hypothetical protein CFP56_45030 [Quercus suber]